VAAARQREANEKRDATNEKTRRCKDGTSEHQDEHTRP
jgi:hypothetical protein